MISEIERDIGACTSGVIIYAEFIISNCYRRSSRRSNNQKSKIIVEKLSAALIGGSGGIAVLVLHPCLGRPYESNCAKLSCLPVTDTDFARERL